jgi:hypothetical protein
MARATRESTKQVLAELRADDPLALGPFVGELAVAVGVSFSLVADMVDVHEQTVLRWIFNRSEIQPQYGVKLARAVAVLNWMRKNWQPLNGTAEERRKQLASAVKTYAALGKR